MEAPTCSIIPGPLTVVGTCTPGAPRFPGCSRLGPCLTIRRDEAHDCSGHPDLLFRLFSSRRQWLDGGTRSVHGATLQGSTRARGRSETGGAHHLETKAAEA